MMVVLLTSMMPSPSALKRKIQDRYLAKPGSLVSNSLAAMMLIEHTATVSFNTQPFLQEIFADYRITSSLELLHGVRTGKIFTIFITPC